MELLPKSRFQFSSADYWNKFFKYRGSTPFEWYGEYPQLCSLLHKYIKPADKTLVIGCGNSRLSADLYDVGYKNITNIDISDIVVQQMAAQNCKLRPEMKWLQMDIMCMEFDDDSFAVVLDKGTLDAVFNDDTPQVHEKVDRMFNEIGRVLRVGGRYICISLSQDHIINKLLAVFPAQGWMFRVHKIVDEEAENDKAPQFPVFVFICTKFKQNGKMPKILEVCLHGDSIQRVDTMEDVTVAVKEQQQYALIRHRLRHGKVFEDQICLQLYAVSSRVPRYILHVVDNLVPGAQKKFAGVFAIFIVPHGRDSEWLFGSNEGRLQLAKQCNFQRLVVVSLHREQQYESLDCVKTELSSNVLQLSPPNLPSGYQVPFLSVGDNIGHRSVVHSGHSSLSGDYVVEDVDTGDGVFRRLIFLCNQNTIQSEAKLISVKSAKKKGKGTCRMRVDHTYLSSLYHRYMIAGVAFIDPVQQDEDVKSTIIGFGGGALASYLHDFTKAIVDAVDIDPEIIEIATKYFGFEKKPGLDVHCADGLQYIKDLQSKGCKQNLILFDVDNKDNSVGISCPPLAFVDKDCLRIVYDVLFENGVFVLNLVCREQAQRSHIIETIKSLFPCVYNVKIPEDVNEIIYACKQECRDLELSLRSKLEEINKEFRKRGANEDLVFIDELIEKLQKVST